MMLHGDGQLHLPPYDGRVAVEYSARCLCGLRYLVFNPPSPGVVGDAEGRATERAGMMGCTFVNSLLQPFVLCGCGECLDFSTAIEVSTVM